MPQCYSMSGEGLLAAARGLSCLRSLNLRGTPLTEEHLTSLALILSSLTSLQVCASACVCVCHPLQPHQPAGVCVYVCASVCTCVGRRVGGVGMIARSQGRACVLASSAWKQVHIFRCKQAPHSPWRPVLFTSHAMNLLHVSRCVCIPPSKQSVQMSLTLWRVLCLRAQVRGIDLGSRAVKALARLTHLKRLTLDACNLGLHHHQFAALSLLTSLTALEVGLRDAFLCIHMCACGWKVMGLCSCGLMCVGGRGGGGRCYQTSHTAGAYANMIGACKGTCTHIPHASNRSGRGSWRLPKHAQILVTTPPNVMPNG